MSTITYGKPVFVKSKNTVEKINLNYNYALIATIVLTIIVNYLFKYQVYAISIAKSVIVSLITTTILTYIINILNKEYQIKKLFTDNNTISISLILGYLCHNLPIHILLIAIVVSIIIKLIVKGANYSASLYGLLCITIYVCFTNFEVTLIDHLPYLETSLAVISFIYLFYQKSIKYNVVISYILTIFSIVFLYTIFNKSSFNSLITTLTSNPIFFLGVFTLPDYRVTPTIKEGQIIFGIITGLIVAIIIFIIPKVIVIPIIIAQLLLTKILENISPKLKYNNRLYYTSLVVLVILVIITIIYFILSK